MILIFVGGFVAAHLSHPPLIQGAGVAPFTVQQITHRTAGENDPTEVFGSTFARRGDGSWSYAVSRSSADGVGGRMLEYVDMQRLISARSEPMTQSIMTFHLSAAELRTDWAAGFAACGELKIEEGSQRSTILGFDVVRVVNDDEFGKEVKWVAPALDCYPLDSAFTGPHGERTTEAVTNVQQAEPSTGLFVPPAGYVERAPREIQALYAEIGSRTKFLPDDVLDLVEKRYQAHRTPPQ
jgi:hypothetical protein